jgi:hypothetical protein
MKIVVTVHGIRTFGQWQRRLENLVRAKDDKIVFVHYNYGYFSSLAFLVPPLRNQAVSKFRKFLLSLRARYPAAEIDIIAHSFGTHLVGWALYEFAARADQKFEQIILAGSVLRVSFAWQELIDRGVVKRVINDCGIHDDILILSQLFVLNTGMAGRLGFQGGMNSEFSNRYFNGGHSLYFTDGGETSDNFMDKFWRPMLVAKVGIEQQDQRVNKGPIQGIILTLLQIADPVKIFYVAVVSLLVNVFYLGPKREAAEQAANAVVARIAEKTSLAARLVESGVNFDRAALHLIDAEELSARKPALARAARYWLQPFMTYQDVISQLPSLHFQTWNGQTFIKVGADLKKYVAGDIVHFFVSADQKWVVLYDSNYRFKVFDRDSLRNLHSFSMEEDKEYDSAAKLGIPLDGTGADKSDYGLRPLSGLRLFSKGSRYIIGLGFTESSYAGGVEGRLLIVDLLMKQHFMIPFSLQGYVSIMKTKACSNFALRIDEERELVFENDRGLLTRARARTRARKTNNDFNEQIICVDAELQELDQRNQLRAALLPPFSFDHDWTQSVIRAKVSLLEPANVPLATPPKSERGERKKSAKGKPELTSPSIERQKSSEPDAAVFRFPSLWPESRFWSVKDGKTTKDVMVKASSSSDESETPDENGQPGVDPKIDILRKYAISVGAVMRLDTSSRNIGDDVLVYGTAPVFKWLGAYFCLFKVSGKPICSSYWLPGSRSLQLWISPDFKRAIIGDAKFMGSPSMHIINLSDLSEFDAPVLPPGAVTDVAFSPDGKRISIITSEGEIWLYQSSDFRLLSRVPLGKGWRVLAFEPEELEGTLLGENPLRIEAEGSLSLLDRFSGDVIWQTRPFSDGDFWSAVSMDGNIVAVLSKMGLIRFLDAESGIALTRPFDLNTVCSKALESISKKKLRPLNESVEFQCDEKFVSRAAPLSKSEYEERKLFMSKYILRDANVPEWVESIGVIE